MNRTTFSVLDRGSYFKGPCQLAYSGHSLMSVPAVT